MNYLKRTIMTSKVTIGIYYFVISKRSDVGLLTSIFNLFKIVNSFFTIGRLSLFMTFYDGNCRINNRILFVIVETMRTNNQITGLQKLYCRVKNSRQLFADWRRSNVTKRRLILSLALRREFRYGCRIYVCR